MSLLSSIVWHKPFIFSFYWTTFNNRQESWNVCFPFLKKYTQTNKSKVVNFLLLTVTITKSMPHKHSLLSKQIKEINQYWFQILNHSVMKPINSYNEMGSNKRYPKTYNISQICINKWPMWQKLTSWTWLTLIQKYVVANTDLQDDPSWTEGHLHSLCIILFLFPV